MFKRIVHNFVLTDILITFTQAVPDKGVPVVKDTKSYNEGTHLTKGRMIAFHKGIPVGKETQTHVEKVSVDKASQTCAADKVSVEKASQTCADGKLSVEKASQTCADGKVSVEKASQTCADGKVSVEKASQTCADGIQKSKETQTCHGGVPVEKDTQTSSYGGQVDKEAQTCTRGIPVNKCVQTFANGIPIDAIKITSSNEEVSAGKDKLISTDQIYDNETQTISTEGVLDEGARTFVDEIPINAIKITSSTAEASDSEAKLISIDRVYASETQTISTDRVPVGSAWNIQDPGHEVVNYEGEVPRAGAKVSDVEGPLETEANTIPTENEDFNEIFFSMQYEQSHLLQTIMIGIQNIQSNSNEILNTIKEGQRAVLNLVDNQNAMILEALKVQQEDKQMIEHQKTQSNKILRTIKEGQKATLNLIDLQYNILLKAVEGQQADKQVLNEQDEDIKERGGAAHGPRKTRFRICRWFAKKFSCLRPNRQ